MQKAITIFSVDAHIWQIVQALIGSEPVFFNPPLAGFSPDDVTYIIYFNILFKFPVFRGFTVCSYVTFEHIISIVDTCTVLVLSKLKK